MLKRTLQMYLALGGTTQVCSPTLTWTGGNTAPASSC